MGKCEDSKTRLIMIAAKLTVLGYEVEHRRGTVKRLADMGIEPTMEMFRAIDDFNNAKNDFDQIEREYLELKASIEAGKDG